MDDEQLDEKAEGKDEEVKRRKHWDTNHKLIKDAYLLIVKEEGRAPTMTEVSKRVNLSYKTVDRHMKELKFDPLQHPARILTEEVLLAIAKSAQKGRSASQKLWMQLVEGWVEKQDITTDGNQINMPVDLSHLTKEELKQYAKLARKTEGTNPELGS